MKLRWTKFDNPGYPGDWYKCDDKLLSLCIEHRSDEGWHMSIAHPYRYPTWEEINYSMSQYLPPNLNYAVYLPKSKNSVGLMPTCFHIYEAKKVLDAGPDRI